jgi:hypothetical protein
VVEVEVEAEVEVEEPVLSKHTLRILQAYNILHQAQHTQSK